jgi:hypothetical protein
MARNRWGLVIGLIALAGCGSSGSSNEDGPAIKGNINSSGEKLYHLQTCPSYDDTQIDESKGERLFATEAEALAAGWRKAGNCA